MFDYRSICFFYENYEFFRSYNIKCFLENVCFGVVLRSKQSYWVIGACAARSLNTPKVGLRPPQKSAYDDRFFDFVFNSPLLSRLDSQINLVRLRGGHLSHLRQMLSNLCCIHDRAKGAHLVSYFLRVLRPPTPYKPYPIVLNSLL